MVKGIVFDKDGTLFDFNATWGVWTKHMIQTEVPDDIARQVALAEAMGFDLQTGVFMPGSIVVSATAGEIADVMLPFLTDATPATLLGRMNSAATQVPQIEATPLRPFLDDLLQRNLILGVATNDAEEPALQHLQSANVLDRFAFVAGYDSGYGGKPDAGQLHGFCRQTGLVPSQCAMVGDSLHDLHAGRGAGMLTMGVLTGPAPEAELAPFADVVLPSVADIPAWLDALQ